MPKRKKYFPSNPAKRKKFCLVPGLKGFICTCDVKQEKACLKEAFNLFNEFSSQANDCTESVKEEEIEAAEDLDAELSKEIEELKSTSNNGSEWKFRSIGTDIKGVVFIKTREHDPVEMTTSIISKIIEKKQQLTRYLIRIHPVETICKATICDIKAAAVELFKKHFKGCDPTTFSILLNRRQHDELNRLELQKELALLVTDCNPLHQVDLKNPHQAVIVELIRNVCCLSVVPNYFEWKKYNLLELANPSQSKNSSDCINSIEPKQVVEEADSTSVKLEDKASESEKPQDIAGGTDDKKSENNCLELNSEKH